MFAEIIVCVKNNLIVQRLENAKLTRLGCVYHVKGNSNHKLCPFIWNIFSFDKCKKNVDCPNKGESCIHKECRRIIGGKPTEHTCTEHSDCPSSCPPKKPGTPHKSCELVDLCKEQKCIVQSLWFNVEWMITQFSYLTSFFIIFNLKRWLAWNAEGGVTPCTTVSYNTSSSLYSPLFKLMPNIHHQCFTLMTLHSTLPTQH